MDLILTQNRLWTHRKSVLSQRGFTLVEMLVVVALIGVLVGFVMPSVSSFFKVSLDKTTREVASLIKETYNSTVVTGLVHRMVYDLDKNTYWVEVGPRSFLIDTVETRQKAEDKKSKLFKEEEKPSVFKMATDITDKARRLPEGVEFEDVLSEIDTEPLKSGKAYTHFFPQGATEQTLIHLKDLQDHKITLVISSLIGRTKLIQGYADRDEVYGAK